ncbi:MAG: hypothetical protein LBL41_03595, partial [Bifidobacteriaceae bacterium]|nr:hypothetical protein [Bifidobacteriaceae bacterium]
MQNPFNHARKSKDYSEHNTSYRFMKSALMRMKSVIVSILVIALVSTNFATINNVRADDTNHPYLTEVT